MLKKGQRIEHYDPRTQTWTPGTVKGKPKGTTMTGVRRIELDDGRVVSATGDMCRVVKGEAKV